MKLVDVRRGGAPYMAFSADGTASYRWTHGAIMQVTPCRLGLQACRRPVYGADSLHKRTAHRHTQTWFVQERFQSPDIANCPASV